MAHSRSESLAEWCLQSDYIYGYAPVIRLKMAISGRHAHIHTDKTDISG